MKHNFVFCALFFSFAVFSANAQVPGMFQPLLIATTSAQVTYTDSQVIAGTASTYTFSGLNFGAASSDRYMICEVGIRNASSTFSISSATIGGISAVAAVTSSNTGASVQNTAAIFVAAVPTGTSGNFVVNLSAASTRAAATCYAATGLNSATPTATNTSTGDNPSGSLVVSPGGIAIGAEFFGTNPFTIPAATWTNLTKDTDLNVGSVNNFSSASVNSAAGQSSTISVSNSNVVVNGTAAVFAAWR